MPTYNYKDAGGIDLGNKGWVTKEYIMTWYPELVAGMISPDLLNWGRNDAGQLGDNSTTSRSSPVRTVANSINWKHVAAGELHSVAVKIDGTLWSWGANASGQLGDNSTTSRSSPVTPSGGGTDWFNAACGTNFTFGIKSDGTLWAWGDNTTGRLGVGNTTNRSSPVTIAGGGLNWKTVAGGTDHGVAIKTDGTLWSWGANANGQVGDGTATARSSPVTPSGGGTTWRTCSAGSTFSVAIKTDGTLWSWGVNAQGQLGDGSATNRSSPVTPSGGGTNWRAVAAGHSHVAAVKTDGTLWCWGRNDYGQVGDGSTTSRSSPVTTAGGATTWKFPAAGFAFTAAIKTDGSLWTWGRNEYGQLSTNNATDRSSPGTTVPTNSNNWKTLVLGHYHGVATTEADGW